MNGQNLLRNLPKMDELLQTEEMIKLSDEYGAKMLLDASRTELDNIRKDILSEKIDIIDNNIVVSRIKSYLKEETKRSLRKVINATGVTLHTNLGRAVIGKKVAKQAFEIACGYSTLEYNCQKGERGSRHDHAKKLLTKLCNVEDAMVVNNNAAAVMLALGAMAKDREVVVSRGELVEIGGAFRVPEIMQLSGNILKEVGTTNKTHLSDYQNAISENTAVLLKVHTSNFKIVGFTEDVSLEDLCKLGNEREVPVIYDLGGGALLPLEKFGIVDEPNVPELLKSGVDILTFSGDKLLGGPQAGIIVGKKKYIDLMKKHPLARAVRADKFTLAMLCETLSCYLDEDTAINEIPTMKMLSLTIPQLQQKAEILSMLLNKNGIITSIHSDVGQVGGGSVPTQMIETRVVKIEQDKISAAALEEALRYQEVPVIARISKDTVLLDVRTIDESEFDIVCNSLVNALKEKGVL